VASRLADAYVQIRTSQDTLAREMGMARTTISRGMQSSGTAAASALGTAFAGIGTALVSMALSTLTQEVKAFAGQMITASSDFEQFRISLDNLYGSVEAGGAAFEEFKKFALLTPFDLKGIVTGARQLRVAKVAAEDVIPVLQRLGDMASVGGGDTETMKTFINVAVKLKSMATAHSREINQIALRGIPLWDHLAKQIGVSELKMRDFVKQGKLCGEEAFKGLMTMADSPTFKNGMARVQGTFQILRSNLHDLFEQLAVQIGEPVFESLKRTITSVNNFLMSDEGKKWGERLKRGLAASVQLIWQFGSAVYGLIRDFDWLGEAIEEAFSIAVRWLKEAYGFVKRHKQEFAILGSVVLGLSVALPAATLAISALGAALAYVGSLLSPLNVLVTTLGFGIYNAFADPALYSQLTAAFQSIGESMSYISRGFWDAFNLIGMAWGDLTDTLAVFFVKVMTNVALFLKNNRVTIRYWIVLIGEMIHGAIMMIKSSIEWLMGFMDRTWSSHGRTITAVWKFIVGVVTWAMESISMIMNNFTLFMKIWAKRIELENAVLWETLVTPVLEFWGFVNGVFDSIVDIVETTVNNILAVWDFLVNALIATAEGFRDALFAMWNFEDLWTGFENGFNRAMDRLEARSFRFRSWWDSAANAFSRGFTEAAGDTTDRSPEIEAELNKMRKLWDKRVKRMREDRTKRWDELNKEREEAVPPKPPPTPKTPPGLPPLGPAKMPKLDTTAPEAKAAKTTFMGIESLWKKVQEDVAGGKMLDLAKQTAENTKQTADSSKATADTLVSLKDAIEDLNTGLE
jgi:tape measure domain-containing protein